MLDKLKRSFQIFSKKEKIGIFIFLIIVLISSVFIVGIYSPSQQLLKEQDKKLENVAREMKNQEKLKREKEESKFQMSKSSSSEIKISKKELENIAQTLETDDITFTDISIEDEDIILTTELTDGDSLDNIKIAKDFYSKFAIELLEQEKDFEYLIVQYLPTNFSIKINRLYAIPNADKQLHFPNYLIESSIEHH